jgi:hypothetical protein
MKQAESKVRHVLAGALLAAVLAVLAGACDGVFTTPLQESQTGDMATVRVAVGSGRSVVNANVPYIVNTYEVVFKKPGTIDRYYRGVGNAADGYVSVSVPVGTGYEVLLLAGYNKTLLAAGYKGANNSIPVGGDAVDIKAGQANVVEITLDPIPLQWIPGAADFLANDFQFDADLTSSGTDLTVDLTDRYIILAAPPVADVTDIDSTDTFTVKFNISKLAPLMLAEGSGADTLTLEGYTVALRPFNALETFTLPAVAPDTNVAGNVFSDPGGTAGIEFEFTGLPNKNIDAALEFTLKYRAFGSTAASGGTVWLIRNGLNGITLDAPGDTGGLILVRIGEGSPVPVTVPAGGYN